MIKSLRNILIGLVVSFCLSAPAFSAGQKLLVVAEDFPPFEYIDDKGKVVGIDVDIARHIFNNLKIDFEVRVLPWKRAWKMIETGQADAVMTTSRKEKRKPFLYYPNEDMWTSKFVFFVNKDKKSPGFSGYKDAVKNKLRVGVISGNSYHDSFWEAFPYRDSQKTKLNKQLDPAPNLETNLRKLARKRIDLFPADITVGRVTLAKLGFQDKISWYEKPLFSKGYPMPFAKKSNYPKPPSL